MCLKNGSTINSYIKQLLVNNIDLRNNQMKTIKKVQVKTGVISIVIVSKKGHNK